jgi:hypothetical protein
MNSTIKILFTVLLFTGLMSCELLDVEFDTNLSSDLNINVEDTGTKSGINGYGYTASTTLDPLSDEDIKEYKDKIDDYSLNSLTATVISVSKPDVKLMAGTFFEIYDSEDNARWTLASDFDVEVGAEYTLDNTEGQWGTVRDILKRNSVFTIASAGEASANNVTIVFEVSIGATVTANPL